MLACTLVAIGMATLVSTVGDMTLADLGKAYEASIGAHCRDVEGLDAARCIRNALESEMNGQVVGNTTGSLDSDSVIMADLEEEAAARAADVAEITFWEGLDVATLMYIYTLVTFLWTVNTVQAVAFIIMATAVATLYWCPAPDNDDSDKEGDESAPKEKRTTECLAKWPVVNAVWQTLRYHLGSAIFGAFLITLAQVRISPVPRGRMGRWTPLLPVLRCVWI